MELACGSSSSGCTKQSPTLAHLKEANCLGPWFGPQSDDSSILSKTWYSDICDKQANPGASVPLLVGHNALEVALWITMGTYANKQNQMGQWVERFLSTSSQQAECVLSQLGKLYENTGKMKAGNSQLA